MHALLKSTNEKPISVEKKIQLKEQINPTLSNECRRRLRYMHMQSFDWNRGGILSPIKFIDRDSVEYSLLIAADGDKNEKRMAKLTLDNAMALVDPVWGGVYQYSTLSEWNVPHYRKTMSAQAGHLRLYSLAYGYLKSDNYLNVTKLIRNYIKNFMTSNDGAFYAGQSGNVKGIDSKKYFSLGKNERNKIGFPEIDKRILTRENSWVIEALATHAEYCGDVESLSMAINAADWINKNCRTSDGGYLTNTVTNKPLHLSDTLGMARAMLQLYRNTFEEKYLKYSCESLEFINHNFRDNYYGFYNKITSENDNTCPRQIDENISLTRFANLLSFYSKEKRFNNISKHGLKYLSIPEIATARIEEAGILLIDRETQSSPLTIDINGHVNNKLVMNFIDIAHRQKGWYKLIRFNKSEDISASIEIEGFKSKFVKTPDELSQLLLTY